MKSDKPAIIFSFLFAGGLCFWFYKQSRLPRLTYQWQGDVLQFNLSGFGFTISGTIDMATPEYQQQFGEYVFTAQPQTIDGAIAAYDFGILKNNEIVYSQTVTKWA